MKRIEYIDAMRGMAMFMVIVYHISFGCFHSENIITKIVNVQLELPLFFFISGFFANKMDDKKFERQLSIKFSHLIIPTLIMMTFYCWVMDFNFIEGLQKRLKEGYWFTFVLFEFIVIYLLTNQFIKRLNLSLSSKKYIHLFIGIILLYIASLSEKYNTQYTIINIFTIGEFSHYIYFVLGSILFPKHEKIVNSMKRNFLWGGIICTYLITDVFRYKYGFAMFRLGAMLSVTILISLGLIIIWGTFIQYKGLSEGNPIGRFLSLIGRRSLDIYFIHYFITSYKHEVCR